MTCLGRILLADDEETFLMAAAELLRRERFECVTVVDARCAAHRVMEEQFDLLISGIEGSGGSYLQLIRDLPRLQRGTPVIVVTGHPSVESAVDCLDLPVAAYLVKPVDMAVLVRCARREIARSRATRAAASLANAVSDWSNELRGAGRHAPSTEACAMGRSAAADLLTASVACMARCSSSLNDLADAVNTDVCSCAADSDVSAAAEVRRHLVGELTALARLAREEGTAVDPGALSQVASRLASLDGGPAGR